MKLENIGLLIVDQFKNLKDWTNLEKERNNY